MFFASSQVFAVAHSFSHQDFFNQNPIQNSSGAKEKGDPNHVDKNCLLCALLNFYKQIFLDHALIFTSFFVSFIFSARFFNFSKSSLIIYSKLPRSPPFQS